MKINIDETSIEKLTELGYVNNSYGTHNFIFIEGKDFHAIKTWHNTDANHGYACDIEHVIINKAPIVNIRVYEYEGTPDKHNTIKDFEELLPFVQELIDAKLLEL